jgi:hypothetical protein
MSANDPQPSTAGRGEPLNLDPSANGIRQYHTHNPLTGTGPQPAPQGSLKLDAIIVPASRTAANLDQALALARAAGCWLVILCSGQLNAKEAREYAAARSYGKVVAADIPNGYSHELLHFQRLRTIRSGLPKACGYYTTDLSIKRNIGLILARMLKWNRIFFLDDDIRDITYSNLQDTVDMLGSYFAAGLWITDFPDNSVVCHANRVTGEKQDVFVSGAALAVNCDVELGFFPEIYNEDWLFFFDYASRGKLANSLLKAAQLEYRPFAHPRRAAWQEFGDVIAEGLYSLVHLNLPIEAATREYWTDFLEARRTFLEDVIWRAEAARSDTPEGLTASVREAVKTLQKIQPLLCERYVRAWREDMTDWSRRLNGVPEMRSIEAALRELRLIPVISASTGRSTLRRQDGALQGATAGPVMIPVSGAMREMSERTKVPPAVPATEARRPPRGPRHARPRRWSLTFWRRLKDRAPSRGGRWTRESRRPTASVRLPKPPGADADRPVPTPVFSGSRFPEYPVSHSVESPVLVTASLVGRVNRGVEV